MGVIDLSTGAIAGGDIVESLPQSDTKRIIDLETGKYVEHTPDPQVIAEPEAVQDEASLKQRILDGFSQLPLVPEIAEYAAGVNRSVADIVDFVGPDTVNAALRLVGSDIQVPTLRENMPGVEGNFMEDGLLKESIRAAGEVTPAAVGIGAGLRSAANQLPKMVSGSESTGAGLLRQMADTTIKGDIALAGASGAGGAIGKDVEGESGELVGMFLAPVAAAGGGQIFKKILNAGGNAIANLTRSLGEFSDEGAAKLLAEAMAREGLSPDDVIKIMSDLGPDAIPADVGNNFARLLRTASNIVPRIEGRSRAVLNQRQAEQTPRMLAAMDDATGTSTLSAEDEIIRLNKTLGPKISQLYDDLRGQNIELSPRLVKMLKSKSSIGRAFNAATKRLEDKVVAGDKIGNIDIIDATKQELDDQIGTFVRQGKNNKVRDLVRLKNLMVDEADTAIPQYKQARDLFAGKAQLENAADMGRNFFKLKSRDVENLVKTMGESEKKMFRLGAKEAVFDRVDSLSQGADAVKRLFGKRGDVRKLTALFDDPKAFNRFSDALEKEAQFTLTRRSAQANSTTAKQLSDIGSAEEVIGATTNLLSNPAAATSQFKQILSGLSQSKQSAAYQQSLEKAGDILLDAGMSAKKLQAILSKGSAKEIERALRVVAKRNDIVLPTSKAAISREITQDDK